MRTKPILPVLMIAAAVVMLLIWMAQRSGEAELGEPAPSPAAAGAARSAPAAAAIPEPAPDPPRRPEPLPAPSPAPAGASERALVESVKSWVAAWSEQRIGDYLGYYARDFAPEGGLSRRQWEAQRRERLASARFVRVAITGLETEMLDAGSARATFLQYYRSDGYTDTVRKTLDLVWEDGRWRIRRERAGDAR